jgi:hypothetical protein
MTPEQERLRAGEARQMIDSTLFQCARQDLEEKLAQLRRTVPISSTEMHTRLILMEQLKEQFFSYFEQIAQTGKLAEIQLEQERQRRSLLEQGIAMFRTSGRNGV